MLTHFTKSEKALLQLTFDTLLKIILSTTWQIFFSFLIGTIKVFSLTSSFFNKTFKDNDNGTQDFITVGYIIGYIN
jgi:hypothetical protein